jgi:hypothetical protein
LTDLEIDLIRLHAEAQALPTDLQRKLSPAELRAIGVRPDGTVMRNSERLASYRPKLAELPSKNYDPRPLAIFLSRSQQECKLLQAQLDAIKAEMKVVLKQVKALTAKVNQ